MLVKNTLVLGGAASGKSQWAETHVMEAGSDRIYLATAQAYDDEMRDKVVAHRAQRGADWETIEAPMDAANVLRSVSAGKLVLLDCATMWLTNHLLAENDLEAEIADLLSACCDCAGSLVIVSNETGLGIVPENALARRFRNAQGRLNQALAAQADHVVLVAAGLALDLKGGAR